jgi:hypothetical protein
LGTIDDPATDHDPADLAKTIEAAPDDAVFFCDANIFIAATDERLWNSLFRKRRTAIIPPVYRELGYWIKDPKGVNLLAHGFMMDLLDAQEELPVFPFQFDPLNQPLFVALTYYINLLSMRKRAMTMMRQHYLEEFGAEPSKQDLNNYCQAKLGERGVRLAADGAEALASKSPNFHTDEELVATAMFFGICTGRETVILTRDEHIQEQFYKLKVLLVDHYFSMYLADRYADDPLAFKTLSMPIAHPWASDVFVGKRDILLRRPSQTLDEILPPNPTCVPIYCWLVREQLTQTCFCAEKEIKRLLGIKGQTAGLSTDRLDGRNCHVWLGKVGVAALGNWVAVAEDRSFRYGPTSLGLLDITLAICNDERFRKVYAVDPRNDVLRVGTN